MKTRNVTESSFKTKCALKPHSADTAHTAGLAGQIKYAFRLAGNEWVNKHDRQASPELEVHEAIVGVCQLLKSIVGQVKVVDVATARRVVSCNSCAVTVILQTGAVVGHMYIDGIVR